MFNKLKWLGIFIIILFIFTYIIYWGSYPNKPLKNTPYKELSVMNTVCIDGILNLSVATKYDLDYVPVVIDGKQIRCGEIDGE